MIIKSAIFIKSVVGTDAILENGLPQIAFIGRSNVGKSSVINSLVNQKDLARTSSFPGRTQELNVFLINKSFYLVDLPGYGYAKIPKEKRDWIEKMSNWYFFGSNYDQALVVFIIDAEVGLTKDDLQVLHKFDDYGKNVVVVANKIDKVKKTELARQLGKIQHMVGNYKVVPYSAEKKLGVSDLLSEMLVF